jgi:ferric-dicitrate binding protein FerR (iron transport regulator)
MAVDYSGDWASVDGVVSVTLTPGGGSAISNVKAKRGTLSYREIMAGGAVGVSLASVAWIVWPSTAGDVIPREGDVITASGVQYKIQFTSELADGSQVRCVCNKFAT